MEIWPLQVATSEVAHFDVIRMRANYDANSNNEIKSRRVIAQPIPNMKVHVTLHSELTTKGDKGVVFFSRKWVVALARDAIWRNGR